jgi:hypothetical protein
METHELFYYAVTLSMELKQAKIVPVADTHYGNPFFSEPHLDRTIEYILVNDDVFAVLVGDLFECITRSSIGDVYTQVGTPQDQRDWVIRKFTPIKHKILGMTAGNHEARVQREVGLDLSADIAKALNVPYRNEGIALKVSVGSGNESHQDRPYTYYLYATHGYGGARTKSAKAVKVERLAQWLHADVYIMAHDHVVNIAPDVYLLPDHRTRKDAETGFDIGSFTAHRKMLVKANAFLKWGGYGERGGFPPVDMARTEILLKATGKPGISVTV